MAKAYQLTAARRLLNVMMTAMVKTGLGPPAAHLLTVVGRKSGLPRTTPVNMIEYDDTRWLVAPYGPVGWVRNARAAGQVTLRRGRRVETVRLSEVGAEQAAPVLRKYLVLSSVVRPFFDVTADSPLEEMVAEAPRHPVFEIHDPVAA